MADKRLRFPHLAINMHAECLQLQMHCIAYTKITQTDKEKNKCAKQESEMYRCMYSDRNELIHYTMCQIEHVGAAKSVEEKNKQVARRWKNKQKLR